MYVPKFPHALFTILCLLAWSTHAQEEGVQDEDVDRILSELEGSTPPMQTESTESAQNETSPLDSEETNPTDVPAISLEDATETEGLSIQASGDDITQGLITVNLSEAPLENVITIFARASGANIIIPQGLTEPVSANLYDVFWRDALDVILADKGYALVERSSGIFTINAMTDIADEPLSSDTIEFQFITAEAALPAVQSLLVSSNANAIALQGSNYLIIREKVQQIDHIKRMVKAIDRPKQQVFVEAKFVELNDSNSSQIGINWEMLGGEDGGLGIGGQLAYGYNETSSRTTLDSEGFTQFNGNSDGRELTTTSEGLTIVDGFNSQFNNFSPDDNSIISTSTVDAGGRRGNGTALLQGRNIGNVTLSDDNSVVLEDPVPNFTRSIARSATLTPIDFALTISALQELDGTQIISNPKILVASGESATIKIGEEIPNIRGEVVESEFSTRTVFSLDEDQPYITDGITIEVSPTVSTDKNITVKIKPELQRLLRFESPDQGRNRFPVLLTRRIDTEFAVHSGYTVAIGGLTTTSEQETVTKVPFLGDLPLIGKYLFSQTVTEDVQDEIIIFITVESINDTAKMNDRDGIPEQGKLIHNWLNFQNEDEEQMEEGEDEDLLVE